MYYEKKLWMVYILSFREFLGGYVADEKHLKLNGQRAID